MKSIYVPLLHFSTLLYLYRYVAHRYRLLLDPRHTTQLSHCSHSRPKPICQSEIWELTFTQPLLARLAHPDHQRRPFHDLVRSQKTEPVQHQPIHPNMGPPILEMVTRNIVVITARMK